MEEYEQIQLLVKEGFINKDFRKYILNEEGEQLVKDIEFKQKDPKKFEKLLKENASNKEYISVSYKKHIMEQNIIDTEVAKFEVEEDGIPVVQVNEESGKMYKKHL
jgi:hypothetical protein